MIIRWIDYINKLVGYLLAFMLGVMAILILLQIFSRFVVSYPLHWTEEVSRYLMIYCVFLGAAIALRRGRLLAIELLSQSISPTARKVLTIVVMLLSIVFFLILIYQSFHVLDTVSRQTSAGAGIPMSIPYAAIPIGAVLLTINSIAVIIETFGSLTDRESEE